MRKRLKATAIVLAAYVAGLAGPDAAQTRDLVFNIIQDVDLYLQTDYGQPAQAAIWLTNPETGEPKTVWVTFCTASGRFSGKVECPNSLPYWIGAFRREFGRDDYPSTRAPLPEAVTGATPKGERFQVRTTVPAGGVWNYCIELNVSGDYNTAFSTFTSDGRPDQYGCGQPSLVYKGTIKAEAGARSRPELIGRTHRTIRSTELLTDLDGITTARGLYREIEVVCE